MNKPTLFTTIIILISIASAACVADDKSNNLYLNFLLNIQNNNLNELQALKQREKVYLNLKSQVARDNAKSDAIKKFLFVGFAAYNRNAASTMEALTSDVMLMYSKNNKKVLNVLKELPFLTESSCYYLGNYFGFEDKHKNEKPGFLSKNKNLITQSLGEKMGKQCISKIEQT